MQKNWSRFVIIILILGFLSTNLTFASTTISEYDRVNNKVKNIKPVAPVGATDSESFSKTVQKSLKSNRILVKYKGGGISAKSASINRRIGGTVLRTFSTINGLTLIELANGVNATKALKAYNNDPQVDYAEPDYPLELRLVAPELPNDEHFSELWGLHNTGQATSSTAAGTEDADINALEAWYITTGSPNAVVAIVDTGVDYTHVDLKENMWVNPNEIPGNGIDDDGNGYIDDIHGIDAIDNDSDPMDNMGHGTHIAGTIAGKGNNTVGITGINWDAKIIAFKIFTETKIQGINGFVSSAIECLDYLYDLKTKQGIDIIATNNSWGWRGVSSMALNEAINRHAKAGILFVAAAGNRNSDNDFISDNPSSYYYPNVIAVAATDNLDQKANFSSFGKHSVHNRGTWSSNFKHHAG